MPGVAEVCTGEKGSARDAGAMVRLQGVEMVKVDKFKHLGFAVIN